MPTMSHSGSVASNHPSEGYSFVSSLEDIQGFRGTRATAVQDNHSFWKRALTAYGTNACREYNVYEGKQQKIRMNRIKSAPVSTVNTERKESTDGKLLPRRCVSEQGFRERERIFIKENRAARLRYRHISHLQSMNAFTGITRMADYKHDMRDNRPSHSARYPRIIPKEKTSTDPEWGKDDYDVYIFHSKSDTKWVSTWLRNLLEAKRFNVKIKATSRDLYRHFGKGYKSPRLIYVLTPEFLRHDFAEMQPHYAYSNVLLIRLRPCTIPDEIPFTCYMDLSFKDMTDKTLQSKLLPKLLSTLQLPKSICS